MERFSLRIELGNDAMRSPEDVALALERVANVLRSIAGPSGTIRDDNGNTVGTWQFAGKRQSKTP